LILISEIELRVIESNKVELFSVLARERSA
jgi:hypothetical protein